jgi:DNA polymerase-3 subunit epsilon
MSHLHLERPLVVLDIESTGTDVATDRIIDLALIRIVPEDLLRKAERTQYLYRFNPMRPIPPSSTRIHGITDADVKGCPSFEDKASEIWEIVAGADICGYNCRNFDVPLLWEEFYRAELEWKVGAIIDPEAIFKTHEPRDLTAAVRKFVGRDHGADAHGALADAEATLEVLMGQRQAYADVGFASVSGLAELSNMETWEGQPATRIDLAGILIRTEDGIARYTHKRVRGVPVEEDPGYGIWMLDKDFSENVKMHLRQLLSMEE